MDFNDQYGEYIVYHQMAAGHDWRRWFRLAVMLDRHETHRWFFTILNNIGGGTMARNHTKQTEKKPSTNNQWTTFVEIPVAPEAWNDIQAAYGKTDDMIDGLEGLLDAGIRVSFSYNANNDSVTCSMTGKDGAGENEGKTVVSYGDTWVSALQVALYKHNVITGGKWGGGSPKESRPAFG